MFSDPQSVTVSGSAKSLPAISRSTDKSIYRIDDATLSLSIGHQFKVERQRFVVRLDANKVAPDPLSASNNRVYTCSTYLVLDKPVVGYTNAEMQAYSAALVAWCTNTNIGRVLGAET